MSIKIGFVSLGCDKNMVDSEIMVALLTQKGYEITKFEEEADVIIVNTCGFIADAKEESINMLIEMGQYKQTGHLKALIAAGCLAQRYSEEIFRELPEVDAVVGTGSYEAIVTAVDELMSGCSEGRYLADPARRDLSYRDRVVLTPGYYGYIRIAEGCDNHCTYCAIPALRGPFRSREEADILHEVQDLARDGVRELMVIAQDITKYGKDRDGKSHLPELLKKLAQVEGIEWIRLLYCYPEDITDELIAVMASEPKICHYIDMPIQHCSDAVLKRMGRRHTRRQLEEVIGKLRRAMPDIALRTTLITGFPGETQQQFEELCDFIQTVRFDRLGVFAYSQEEGTAAGRMPDQLEDELKEQRKDQLMAIQQEISSALSDRFVGEIMEVMIDGLIPDEGDLPEGTHVYQARTFRDAPDIDGFLFLTSDQEHQSGDFVKAEVTGSFEYDLMGAEITEE